MAPSSPATAIIGPLTLDVIDGEERPGGAVAYAARIANALGERVAILTIGASDCDRVAFEGHDLCVVEDRTLTFEHSDAGGTRRLRLLDRPSRPLHGSDLPTHWDRLTTLIFAPLLPDDIDIESFANTEGIKGRALLAQGLQRDIASDATIEHRDAASERLLPLLSVETSLFLSAEEIEGWDEAALPPLIDACARVVVTEGADGATIHRADCPSLHVDAAAANAVDTTGAGDVFATAFMLALAAGSSDDAAARLASASAAAAVERPGVAAISIDDIDARPRPRTFVGAR